jgi:hypothetical protein
MGANVGQIIFHCTHCGAKLSAGLNEAGEEFECPECKHLQKVPGGAPEGSAAQQTAPGAPPPAKRTDSGGMPVIHIPKRKIVLSAAADEEEDDEDEYEELEEIGGQGLGLFAVALGTAGLILCVISMVWMFISQRTGNSDWWISLVVFIATFLMGLMGLVLAQLSRLVVRLADRVAQLGVDEDE